MKYLLIIALLASKTIYIESQIISMPFNRLGSSHILRDQYDSQKVMNKCKLYIVKIELENFKEINKEFQSIEYFQCLNYIREYNFKRQEEKRQQQMEIKQNKEDEIYRTHLVSLISSSVLKDFFAMRY